MFFRVLAAMVTADAFDRHQRQQQHRAWLAEGARQQTTQAGAMTDPLWPSPKAASDPQPARLDRPT